MSINNIPDIGPYTELKPFRFWCQKVLPITYDDSLSYYELLCKVVDYLNKTMEDVDQVVTDMSDFKAAYEELITYVNNYFDNLDITEEINAKLDTMAEDGTLTNLIAPFFADAIAAVPDVVTNWLEDNIVQETGYVIDKTLRTENAAADALATGEYIRKLGDVNSENLWPFDDQTINGRKSFAVSLPAGTYSISAFMDWTNAPSSHQTRISFSYNGNTEATDFMIGDDERRSITVTLANGADTILLYSGSTLSDAQNYTLTYKKIMLNSGAIPLPYKPDFVAHDYIAREKDPDNLWCFGDYVVNEKRDFYIKLTHDEAYVISADVETDASTKIVRIGLFGPSNTDLGYVALPIHKSSICFVPTGDTAYIRLYAANTNAASTGHQATYKNVRLVKGTGLKDITGKGVIFDMEDVTITSSGNHTFNAVKPEGISPEQLIIDIDATYTSANANKYAVPKIRFYYTDSSIGSSFFTVGGKSRTHKTYRFPEMPGYAAPYTNMLTMQLNIPTDVSLTIHKMTVRLATNNKQYDSENMRIYSHGSYLFYPQHNYQAFNAMARCGAKYAITIPKISSDDVWFCYHDDTFDITTTILRNPDGSAIASSEYNNEAFRNIPFSYLAAFDWGIYRDSVFAGTGPLLVEDFLLICKRNSMKPAFSIHPSPYTEEVTKLYNLCDRLNCIDTLTLKCPKQADNWTLTALHNKFGEEIEAYILNIPSNAHTDADIAAAITALDNLNIPADSKTRYVIETYVDKVTQDQINAIRVAGYGVSVTSASHTEAGGQSGVLYLTEEDYYKLSSMGVTEFSDNHNSSLGLNW